MLSVFKGNIFPQFPTRDKFYLVSFTYKADFVPKGVPPPVWMFPRNDSLKKSQNDVFKYLLNGARGRWY